jgi:hypothetical protein
MNDRDDNLSLYTFQLLCTSLKQALKKDFENFFRRIKKINDIFMSFLQRSFEVIKYWKKKGR